MATETYELAIDGTEQQSYRSTVLHFSGVGVATGDTLAAAESLVNGWDTSIKALWLATLPATYFLMQLRARRVNIVGSAVGHKTYGALNTPGTRGSNATGQQICPSIFLVPTMGTKSGGKIFWPCIPQGDLDQSNYAAAWKTAVDAVISACITGFTNSGITWTLCVYSRKLNLTSNVAGHNYSPVIGFQSRRRRPTGAVA